MKAVSSKLVNILRDIKDNTVVVPRFQRDFVWDTAATCKLIDSIARDYPIGALLALPAEALSLPCTELKWAGAKTVVEARPGSFYLLDGQQRLTSIARALLADKTYQYLFDLDAIYRELSDPTMYVNEEWVICRRKQEKLVTDVGFLRCEDVVQAGTAYGKVRIFLKSKFPDAQEGELITKSSGLLEVLETVRNYQVIVHQMEKNEKPDSICRIFETINSTGVRLDTFDLVVAKSYSLSYDLREKVNEIKQQYPLVEDFADENILHAIYYFTGLVEQKRPTLTKAALLATPPAVWANSLERAATAFTTVAKWLLQNGLHSSTNENLVPAALQTIIVVCEMLYPGSIDSQVVSVELKRWLLARLSSSQNYNKSTFESDLTTLKTFFEAPRMVASKAHLDTYAKLDVAVSHLPADVPADIARVIGELTTIVPAALIGEQQ
jgi:hypothetical protein